MNKIRLTLLLMALIIANLNIKGSQNTADTKTPQIGKHAYAEASAIHAVHSAIQKIENLMTERRKTLTTIQTESLKTVNQAKDLLNKINTEVEGIKLNAAKAYRKIEEVLRNAKDLENKLASTESKFFSDILSKIKTSIETLTDSGKQ